MLSAQYNPSCTSWQISRTTVCWCYSDNAAKFVQDNGQKAMLPEVRQVDCRDTRPLHGICPAPSTEVSYRLWRKAAAGRRVHISQA